MRSSRMVFIDNACLFYFSHFLFLVKGIYTLQKLSITQNEIESAEEDLKVFVFQTDKLYGKDCFILNNRALF